MLFEGNENRIFYDIPSLFMFRRRVIIDILLSSLFFDTGKFIFEIDDFIVDGLCAF
jgi:hypothetical protein